MYYEDGLVINTLQVIKEDGWHSQQLSKEK